MQPFIPTSSTKLSLLVDYNPKEDTSRHFYLQYGGHSLLLLNLWPCVDLQDVSLLNCGHLVSEKVPEFQDEKCSSA